MEYAKLKKKYVGLDIFRVVCALMTCAYHTTIFLGATYSIFTPVAKMGAIYMTAFFMLSGFTLFVNYAGQDIMKIKSLKSFWLKRIIGIIPMYYIVAFLLIVFRMIIYPSTAYDRFILNLWLAPIEALGIQSNFSSLFDFSHNGLTWFISCIIMCYLIYPFLQEVIKQLNMRSKIIIIAVSVFILLYSPIIVRKLEISSIYSNPFFRILEFTIGIVLASMKIDLDEIPFVKKRVFNLGSIVTVAIIMMTGITVAVNANFATEDYMMYSCISLPCFIFILFGLSGIKSKTQEKSKLLSYCSNISYVFFLSQWFSNIICMLIIEKYNINNNLTKVFLGWITCIIIAIVLHEFLEKPITKKIRKKFHKTLL